jgi:hypothetical protein
MSDNEVKAHLFSTIRNSFVVLCSAATVTILFYLSNSWHSLWALLLLFGLSKLRTGKAAEIEAEAEREAAARADRVSD